MRTMLAKLVAFNAVVSGAPLSNSDRLAQLEAQVKGLEKHRVNLVTNKTDVSEQACCSETEQACECCNFDICDDFVCASCNADTGFKWECQKYC